MAQTPDKPKKGILAQPKKVGRPTHYTPEFAQLILDRISTCNVGLRNLCKMYDDMPDPDTIYQWRYKHDDFAERYLNSRRKQAHFLAEQVKDIAEETRDYMYEDEKGAVRVDSGIVAMQKFRMTANTWLAARINPKEYGEKQLVEHTTSENESLKAELAALRAQLAEKNKSDY